MPQVEDGPQGLNRTLETTYRSAINSGKSKGQASAIAWSAAKENYKKESGKWVAKLYYDLATLCKDMGNPAFTGNRSMLQKVGHLCISEYQGLTKEEDKVDNKNRKVDNDKQSEEIEDPSFTGESGPIWDHKGQPLRGSYLEHETGKADIGIKPTALGENPIRGFNYDPSASGSAGGREGAEYTNQNVPTASHGREDDRGTRKILDSLRNIQALTKGGSPLIKHPGHPDQGVHDPTGGKGRGGKPAAKPSGKKPSAAAREAVKKPAKQKPDARVAAEQVKTAYKKAKVVIDDTVGSIDRLTTEWKDAKESFDEATGATRAVFGAGVKRLKEAVRDAYNKYKRVKANAGKLARQYNSLVGDEEELSPRESSPRPEDVHEVLDDDDYR